VGLEGERHVNEVPVIAIVDDDVSVRRSLHRLVRTAGYAVETFASAREFLDWLPRGQAACLVLDVHMDGMSGFELQQRLAVPVIFMTSHDDAHTRDRVTRAGVAGHLWKPFDEQAVLDAIGRAVASGDGTGDGRPGTPHKDG
jgi:FixJ family two-component response regulator